MRRGERGRACLLFCKYLCIEFAAVWHHPRVRGIFRLACIAFGLGHSQRNSFAFLIAWNLWESSSGSLFIQFFCFYSAIVVYWLIWRPDHKYENNNCSSKRNSINSGKWNPHHLALNVIFVGFQLENFRLLIGRSILERTLRQTTVIPAISNMIIASIWMNLRWVKSQMSNCWIADVTHNYYDAKTRRNEMGIAQNEKKKKNDGPLFGFPIPLSFSILRNEKNR